MQVYNVEQRRAQYLSLQKKASRNQFFAAVTFGLWVISVAIRNLWMSDANTSNLILNELWLPVGILIWFSYASSKTKKFRASSITVTDQINTLNDVLSWDLENNVSPATIQELEAYRAKLVQEEECNINL